MRKPRVDHESLRAKYGDCQWETREDTHRYILRFKSQDGDYTLAAPTVAQMAGDDFWRVRFGMDYERSGSHNDRCYVQLFYDLERCELFGGEIYYERGGEYEAPTLIFALAEKLIDKSGYPGLAKLVEFAGNVIEYILGNLGDWMDGGGRPNFMAVVTHAIARVQNSMLISDGDEVEDVWIYQDDWYREFNRRLGPGEYDDLDAIGYPNDFVSSIEIPPNWTVTAWEHIHFEGECRSYGQHVSNLEDFNDRISSLRILEPPPWPVLYREYDFEGESRELRQEGYVDLTSLGFGVSSVRIPRGWQLWFYETTDPVGPPALVTSISCNLTSINDKAKCVVLERQS